MKSSKLFAITLQSKIRYRFLLALVVYHLLLGVYLKDYLAVSPILLTFYLLSALPTLFLLADVRSRGMRTIIFITLFCIFIINIVYLFGCRRVFLFPTIISLVIPLIYFAALIEEPRKDSLPTKIYVLAVTGIIAITLISAYGDIAEPEAPYLDNGRDTLWNVHTEELADALCSGCDTDAEKAKAFHKWIVENFEYDFDCDPFIQYFDASKTVSTKQGICYDFSHLFAAFCRSQNIPCYVVDGISHTNPNDAHTWNRVYFDGAWWNVDITSDISSTDAGKDLYGFRKLDSAYSEDTQYFITKIY